MNWFVRNVLVVHLFALVVAFSWIHGGTRADLLMPVIPWLTLFILEFLLVFPQAKSMETIMDARRRVWHSLKRDPLVYISLFLLALLVIPLFNVADPPVFDSATQRWINSKPLHDWLPFCVSTDQHAVLLLWFPPALTAALAARHGLLKRGKRLLIEMICWNGAVLAVIGFAQLVTRTDSLLWFVPLESQFFSTFGYPNFAGAFFTLVFSLSAGLWMYESTLFMQSEQFAITQSKKNFFNKHRMFLPMVLCFVAAMATLSRAAILLSILVFAVLCVYMTIFVWRRISKEAQVKIFAGIFFVIAVVAVSLMIFKLKGFKAELSQLSYDAVVARVSGNGQYHVRVAKEIYKDHSVFGVGGWGYPHYKMQYMTAEDLEHMQITGGVNVHNDSWQFLAEQGYVGFGTMLTCVLMLILPLLVSVVGLMKNAFRLSKKDVDKNSPSSHWLYCIPLPLIAVFIGTTATVCHSLGDLPFRNPAVLTIWILAFACVPGWLPVMRKK